MNLVVVRARSMYFLLEIRSHSETSKQACYSWNFLFSVSSVSLDEFIDRRDMRLQWLVRRVFEQTIVEAANAVMRAWRRKTRKASRERQRRSRISDFGIEGRGGDELVKFWVVNEKAATSQDACDDHCWRKLLSVRLSVKSSIQLDMSSFSECAYFLFEVSMVWIGVGRMRMRWRRMELTFG